MAANNSEDCRKVDFSVLLCYDLIKVFGGKMKSFTCSKRNTLIFISSFIAVCLLINCLKGGPHFIPMLIGLVFFVLILFFFGNFWLIKYDDLGFTYTGRGRYKIEYDDIMSVTHHTVKNVGRSSIDHFIIKYSCIVENSEEREIQKLELGNYPEIETREFFSYMKERNPKIEFSSQMATKDSMEITEFDYF